MKKLDGILKRVEILEYKKGINYAKTDGRLFKTLKTIYNILYIYTFVMNLFFVGSLFLKIESGEEILSQVSNQLITVCVCTVAILASIVLSRFKLHLTAGITSILSLSFLLPVFSNLLDESINGLFGFKWSFYWRHFIPIAIMAFLTVWMTVIAIRARIKTDRMYKRVVENLFNNYKLNQADADNISEEKWNEFLNNYNPYDYTLKKKSDPKRNIKIVEDENEG